MKRVYTVDPLTSHYEAVLSTITGVSSTIAYIVVAGVAGMIIESALGWWAGALIAGPYLACSLIVIVRAAERVLSAWTDHRFPEVP